MNHHLNKILTTVIACGLITGCGVGFNPVKVRAAVIADHPGAEVVILPGRDYTYLVRLPNGAVMYVEYLGSDPKITSSVLMFNPKP